MPPQERPLIRVGNRMVPGPPRRTASATALRERGTDLASMLQEVFGGLDVEGGSPTPPTTMTVGEPFKANLAGLGGPAPLRVDLNNMGQMAPPADPSRIDVEALQAANAERDPLTMQVSESDLGRSSADDLVKRWINAGPLGFLRGLNQIGEADIARSRGETDPNAYYRGGTETLRGLGMSALPVMGPAMGAASMTGAGAARLGAAMVAGPFIAEGAAKATEALGGSQDAQELAREVGYVADPFHMGSALKAGVMGAAVMGGLRKTGAKAGGNAASQLVRWTREGLDPQVRARYDGAVTEVPGFQQAAAHLEPAELELVLKNPQQFTDLRSQMPDADLMAGPILAGSLKRGWYKESRRAIEHVFQGDADLFAGVLAATSPQNSVEMNLQNATRIYANWVKAGRPTEERAILKIMGESVLGNKGEKSALDAWKNNTVRVLQGGTEISGPKVDSFWANLRARPRTQFGKTTVPEDAVTIDAWAGHILGAKSELFKGTRLKGALDAGDPGMSPGYLAATSVMREAAAKLGLTPSEAQEMSWSFAKALYETAEAKGVSAVELMRQGGLTAKQIQDTPDFSRLLLAQDAQALRGVSPQMDAQMASLSGSAPVSQMAMTPAQEASAIAGAQRLDILRSTRGVGSRALAGVNAPGTVDAIVPIEGTGGLRSGVYPESRQTFTVKRDGTRVPIPEQTQNARGNAMLDTSEDILGRNVMVSSAFPDASSVQNRGVGVYKNDAGRIERNRVGVSHADVRVGADGTPDAEDVAALAQAHLAQSVMMGQDVAATALAKFTPEPGKISGLRFTTPSPWTRPQVESLSKKLPADVYSVINDKTGLNIVRYDGTPMSADDQRMVVSAIRRRVVNKAERATVVKGAKEFETLDAGIGYRVIPWGKSGSRTVTNMLEAGNAGISPARLASMDTGAKAQAKSVLRLLESSAKGAKKGAKKTRADHLNLLRVLAADGLSGLIKALGDPSLLLPTLAAIGVSTSFIDALQSSPSQTSRKEPG